MILMAIPVNNETMKPAWKEILTFLNTALIAGLLFYSHHPDSNGAIICSLAIFIATLLLYFFLYFFRKRR